MSGPSLALVQIPSGWRSSLESALARVWTGRLVWYTQPPGSLSGAADDRAAITILCGDDPEALFSLAETCVETFPDGGVLIVTEGAKALRSQRGGLPRTVVWALDRDEIDDARLLGLALRMTLEMGNRRKLEAQLEGALPMAELGFLASAIGHEIGSPLTCLLTNLELARASCGSGPVEEALTDALDAARHLARVATDLGRVSGRAGRLVAVDLRSVVESARRLCSGALERVDVTVRDKRPVVARADETRLCQVLVNLLRNAARATRRRSAPQIIVDVLMDGDQAVLRVSDNGSGVPQPVVKRLFEPWFTTATDGTGIGLALCRRYLTDMGGTVDLIDTSPAGAVFEVRLPLGQFAAARPTLVPDGDRTSARVLVLDDAPLIRRAIARALTPHHHVDLAPSMLAALGCLEKMRYDVVFVDLHLDGGSGIDFHAEVQQRFANRVGATVFLSGAFGQKDLAYIESHGLAWVRKPVGAEDLRHLVAEIIAR